MDRNRSRRSYLKLVGSAAGTPLACCGSLDGVGSDYSEIVDVVEAGADDAGEAPVDDVVVTAIEDDTLLEFPEGRYLVEELTLTELSNAGLRATGDATLVPSENCDDWLTVSRVTDFLFEGFTLDHTAEGCAPTVVLRADDGLEVRDVRKKGFHDSDNTAFGFAVVDQSGTGLVENLRMTDGSIPLRPVGIYVQGTGTITFRDCHVEGFGNNGLYASMADGPVRVEGGVYRNNDRSNVRLGSADSYVRGARIVAEDTESTVLNLRGVRVSDGPGPVTVENCDVRMLGGQGMGGIVNAYNGGSLVVRDTRIEVGPGYQDLTESHTGYGVLLDEPTQVETGTRTLQNVVIVGGGRGGAAVCVRRGRTTFEQCCIHQTGTRDGVLFEKSPAPVTIERSTVDVTGEPFVGEVALERRDVAYAGSCSDGSLDRSAEETRYLLARARAIGRGGWQYLLRSLEGLTA